MKTSGLVLELIAKLGDKDLDHTVEYQDFMGLLQEVESLEETEDIYLLEKMNGELLMFTLTVMELAGSSDMKIDITGRSFEKTLGKLIGDKNDNVDIKKATYILLLLMLIKLKLEIELRIGCLKLLASKTTKKTAAMI